MSYSATSLSIDSLKPVLDGNGALTDFEVSCTLTCTTESGATVSLPVKASAFTDGDAAKIDISSQIFAAVYQTLKTKFGVP